MWFLYQQITGCTKRALWSLRNREDKASPLFLPGVCLLTLIPSKAPLLSVFFFPNAEILPRLGLTSPPYWHLGVRAFADYSLPDKHLGA